MVVGDLKAELQRYAHSLGFSHVGIAAAGVLPAERERLQSWLAKGYHAEMTWMERDPERRADPRQVLEGAQTVISVAMNYYHPVDHERDRTRGLLSRYAWGDDYHDVMDIPLKKLEAWLAQRVPESQSRRYIDTGPVMDKAWAVQAGIGWLGKNGNVITRDLGSWVFLGEIITTASLSPDVPIQDYCGSCTACLDACPTRAIVEPYVVDSTRCISYLTIEYRGEELPEGASMNFDGWLYGCDTCQDVCPWNSNAVESPLAAFAPRSGETSLPLSVASSMEDSAFRERFRRSPVKRTKSSGLRRNARTLLAQQESNTDR